MSFNFPFLRKLNCLTEPFERILQYGTRGGDVESHEAFAAFAEHLAVVEGEAGFLYKQVVELLMVETEVATVEPYEERSLWPPSRFLAMKALGSRAKQGMKPVAATVLFSADALRSSR